MDYRDYIKEEYCDAYVQERDNLTDGLIDAKCNLLFLKMCIERDEIYRNNNLKKKNGIGLIVKKIYITVAWQLALQIKAFTDDNDKDCLTVRFLYNGIIIKHQKTEPTYTKTSLFLCEKRRFFMARREKGVVPIIYFEKERGKSF